ncbi:hypothetical protein AB0910_24980 [Streptomyces sp. NPDC047002]|uniref:hypothetical protein n=1 Tax=Streptomyces sp. NPDC047002 TaxID=3155475 RepID=UPI003454D07E
MTERTATRVATWQQLFDVTGSVGRGVLAPDAWRGARGRRLVHSDEAWTAAAAALREAGGRIAPVGAEFARAHEGVAAGLGALAAAGALGDVRGSWERRFDAAAVECEEVARALVGVAEAQGAREAVIRGTFGAATGTSGGAGHSAGAAGSAGAGAGASSGADASAVVGAAFGGGRDGGTA